MLRTLAAYLGICERTAKKTVQICRDYVKLLSKKEHFISLTKKYAPLEENGLARPDLESESPMASTIHESIQWLARTLVQHIDAQVSRENTNQHATATLKLGGVDYELPATALLSLENIITNTIRPLFQKHMTNDPNIKWEWNENEQCYTAPPQIRFVTENKVIYTEFPDAKGKFPAQIKERTEKVNVGTITTYQNSGLISSAQKAKSLDNIDELLILVSQARHKANETAVKEVEIGRALFEFILKGVWPQ